MKTLITSLLIILSASAFADDKKAQNDNTTPVAIAQPEFVWGDADGGFDELSLTIDELSLTEMSVLTYDAPEFVWGNASDLDNSFLAPEMPDFVWGNAQDEIVLTDAPAIASPEFVWGDSSESIAIN